jgi:hemoglobin-like flavoprotein
MSAIEDVSQSYGRCCAQDGFFAAFYERFMQRDPAVAVLFANTDMDKQRQLLRHGILLLIMHARGMPGSKLHDLGRSHCRARMNIEAWMYDVWVDALIDTVRDYDPKWQDTLEAPWRATLATGLDIMQSHFDDAA